MSRKFMFVVGCICVLLISAGILASGWRFANPDYQWTSFDGRTYTAEIPSHWMVKVHRPEPDQWSTFIESSRFRLALQIEDYGTKEGSLEALASVEHTKDDSPSSMKRVRLANGVEAYTWTAAKTLAVEVGAEYRTYVFLSPNNRLYMTMHYLYDWKRDWRSDNLTRRILGSMKFKDAAPPKK